MEDLILFLSQVERLVPPQATIVVLQGHGAPFLTPVMVYLLAIGQLPQQLVLYDGTFSGAAAKADYVALYKGGSDEPGLVRVASIGGGTLYRSAR
jgi:hypothetical protein